MATRFFYWTAEQPAGRMAADAGIAIGPILFIIAVLGILAAAIAAGSGSFTAGSGTESNRTKASATIEIGQNLKIGFDRIVGNGIDFNNVTIDINNTADSNDLFSPSGGGIAVPATTMANTPTSDIWYYPQGAIPQMGTSADDQLAMIQVAQGVCDEVNNKANAIVNSTTTTITAADEGDPITGGSGFSAKVAANWPVPLYGHPTGCVYNNNSSAPGFWFYQVMGIR